VEAIDQAKSLSVTCSIGHRWRLLSTDLRR
jgi:hypothetical protein